MVKKEGGLFNSIAPIYGLFYNYQVNYYRKIMARVGKELNLSGYGTVIDVGCGTGALCHVLNERGLKVTGVDAAQRMLDMAEKKLSNSTIDLRHANVLEGIPFADKSFDVAIASYVVHGLKQPERELVYAEMARVAKHLVIFHEYNQRKALHISLAEWLEQGDYFNFIKIAESEMARNFKKVMVLNVTRHAAWYICTPFTPTPFA